MTPDNPDNTNTTDSVSNPTTPQPVECTSSQTSEDSPNARHTDPTDKPAIAKQADKLTPATNPNDAPTTTGKPDKPRKPRKVTGTPRGTEHKPNAVRKMVSNVVAATGSSYQAANLLGIPAATIQNILTRSPDQLGEAKKAMAQKCLILGEKAAELTAGKLDQVRSPMEAATIMGIAIDKAARLTDGQTPLVAIQLNAVGELGSALKAIVTPAPDI